MLLRRQSSHAGDGAPEEDSRRPVRDGCAGHALEPFPAPGAEAVVVVRITDVIEVQAIDVVVAGDFEQRVDFELLVFGMRGQSQGSSWPRELACNRPSFRMRSRNSLGAAWPKFQFTFQT